MEKIQNFIGGALTPPASGLYFDSINPAEGKPWVLVPDSGAEDVASAVAAAELARVAWAQTSATERSRLLLAIAEGIEADLEVLAQWESEDNGKPVSLARAVDIPRAAANFRFFATAILHSNAEAHPTDQVAINYTTRSPLGTVACISPWNLPLYLFTWKIAPALAAGNTVVAKPSEITPYTAYHLSKICQRVGLPAGVLNIVHGSGPQVGQPLVEHPQVKAISFTGGTTTGKQIAATAAPLFKKLSLELGGKNPVLVFDDCDFNQALEVTLASSFRNQGEICLCGSRVLVQEGIYDRFKEALVARTQALKVGDPRDVDTDLGALVSLSHFEKVKSYVALALEEGATLLAGGESVAVGGRCADGYFLEPTILEGLGPKCRTNQEEIFGPVITLQPFKDEAEALVLANDTPYGLASVVWTQDLSKAHRVAAKVESGIVWVNCWMLRDLRTPFGGVKQSGVGREGGWEALRFFTEPKNICIKLQP